jgi:hypothetical protein
MGMTIWAEDKCIRTHEEELKYELAFLESKQKNTSRWMTQEEQDRMLVLRKELYESGI